MSTSDKHSQRFPSFAIAEDTALPSGHLYNEEHTGENSLDTLRLPSESQAASPRFTLDVLELAANLTDFHSYINTPSIPEVLFAETNKRISTLIPFTATVVYSDSTSPSTLDEITEWPAIFSEPHPVPAELAKELRELLHSGMLTVAVNHGKPVITYTTNKAYKLVLQPLNTASRTHGVFIGIMPNDGQTLCSVTLTLVSMVLGQCAYALESTEQYRSLQNSLHGYDALADLPVPVLDCLPDGSILAANKAMKQILGVSGNALIRLPLTAIFAQDTLRALEKLLCNTSSTSAHSSSFAIHDTRSEVVEAVIYPAGQARHVLCRATLLSPCKPSVKSCGAEHTMYQPTAITMSQASSAGSNDTSQLLGAPHTAHSARQERPSVFSGSNIENDSRIRIVLSPQI